MPKETKPAARKRQDENQLAGRRGELLASFCFPDEWVVRPLPHDFGLDLEVEPFYEIPDDSNNRARYETRGEHLYVQVKTVDTVSFVAPTSPALSDAPAHRLMLETSELRLAEEMGASVPILLLLVHRAEETIYYLCLTDYVAKALAATSPTWREQQSASVWIPERNRLRVGSGGQPEHAVEYFLQLARRGKYFTAFNYLWRVKAEIDHHLALVEEVQPRVEYFRTLTRNFHRTMSTELQQLLRLDLWTLEGNPPVFSQTHDILHEIADTYTYSDEQMSSESLSGLSTDDLKDFIEQYREDAMTVGGLADRAATIGATFESVLRTARLPTELSGYIS